MLTFYSYAAIAITMVVATISIGIIYSASKLSPAQQADQRVAKDSKFTLDTEKSLARRGYMTWSEYISRAEYISDMLLTATEQHHFKLDFIIGISGGGLIVADLIAKNIDTKFAVPVASLWADWGKNVNGSTSHASFSSDYNLALVEHLTQVQQQLKRPLSVVLVDHRVVSGQTAYCAIEFLEAKLGKRNIQILFFTLMAKQVESLLRFEEHLPYQYTNGSAEKVFNLTRHQYLQSLATKAEYLPYQLSAIENHRTN